VEQPAAALAKVAAKGKDVAQQRKDTIEAAERGDEVAAFLGLDAITTDVRKVAKRLGRAAKATEAAGQFTAMTGVVAQQHKNLDLRGRLGAHPGFVPQKITPGEQSPSFNLTINLPGGQTERLSTVVEPRPGDGPYAPIADTPMIDATPIPAAPDGEQIDDGFVKHIASEAKKFDKPDAEEIAATLIPATPDDGEEIDDAIVIDTPTVRWVGRPGGEWWSERRVDPRTGAPVERPGVEPEGVKLGKLFSPKS
jgi:hypothetical protein